MRVPWDGRALHWRGFPSHQLPEDLLRLQEEIVVRRPATIIETGSGEGGTTLFLADLCQHLNHGRVVAIEKTTRVALEHPRVEWHTGDSVERAGKLVLTAPTMVILDSDVYSETHCAEELRAYAPFVTPGQLLVACHADRPDWGMRSALGSFLEQQHEFENTAEERPTLHAWLVRQ